VVTSAPSAIPVVVGDERESTVHSWNVPVAAIFGSEDRTGVSSGAKIVSTSLRSSLLEAAEPGLVVSYVFDSDILCIQVRRDCATIALLAVFGSHLYFQTL
jgi:hypothetical protein